MQIARLAQDTRRQAAAAAVFPLPQLVFKETTEIQQHVVVVPWHKVAFLFLARDMEFASDVCTCAW